MPAISFAKNLCAFDFSDLAKQLYKIYEELSKTGKNQTCFVPIKHTLKCIGSSFTFIIYWPLS